MRTAVRSFVRALSLLAIVYNAGCATTPDEAATTAGAGAATGESVVTVDNNHNSFSAMTIFLVPDAGGVRQSLGVTEAGQSRSFSLTLRGWYTLIAQHTGGDVRSDRFHVAGRSTIMWDLQLNRVRVATR
jgi:hypothetical protein